MSNKTPPVEPLDDSALDAVQGGVASVATRTGGKIVKRPGTLEKTGLGADGPKIVAEGGGNDI